MTILNSRTFALMLALASLPAWSQTCQQRNEIPEASRTAIENIAQQIFEQAARGDSNAIKANTIPSVAANFNGIQGAVNDNKPAFQGARPQLRTSYLLDTGDASSADGRYYCGVFDANGLEASGAVLMLPNLDLGKWAVVIQDFIGPKGPYALTTIYQDLTKNNGWKLAGFQVRPESASGHDGIWYLERARDYKSKGQIHNAWFYYVTSWDLLAPATFMHTNLLGKINDELAKVQPKDIPSGNPVSYSVNGKTYSITEMSVLRTDNSFDLNIRYSVPSTADFNSTMADARNLGTAYAAQYPELKDAFNKIWVHAVDANGGDVPGLVELRAAK